MQVYMWVYIYVGLRIRIYTHFYTHFYTHIYATSEAETEIERRFRTGTGVTESLSLSCHLLSLSLFKYHLTPARIFQSREMFLFLFFYFRWEHFPTTPPFHFLFVFVPQHRACVLIHRHTRTHAHRHSCLQTHRHSCLPPRMLGRCTYYYYYYYYYIFVPAVSEVAAF